MTNPAVIAKALTGAVIAALAALGTALTDGGVSPAEWTAVALAFFVALSTVYAVPNASQVPPADYTRTADVVAVDVGDGRVVAGPASHLTDGTAVDVEPTAT